MIFEYNFDIVKSYTTNLNFLFADQKSVSGGNIVKRPLNPPPPTPSPSNRLSNGRSNESISSMSSEVDQGHNNPIPPPRKVSFLRIIKTFLGGLYHTICFCHDKYKTCIV